MKRVATIRMPSKEVGDRLAKLKPGNQVRVATKNTKSISVWASQIASAVGGAINRTFATRKEPDGIWITAIDVAGQKGTKL